MAQITLTTYENATSFELNDSEIVYMNPYVIDGVVVGTEITITDTAGVNNLPLYVSQTVSQIALLTTKLVQITLLSRATPYISISRIVELITVDDLAVIIYNNNGNVYQRLKTDMTVEEVLSAIQTEENEPQTYTVLLNQSSTSAPTLGVLTNSLTESVTSSYTLVGRYKINCSLFTDVSKIFLTFPNEDGGGGGKILISYGGTGFILIETTDYDGVYSNDVLTNTPLRIEVYP